MAHIDPNLSTGLSGLDQVLRGLMAGDNIVWQIDAIEDYKPFVDAACKSAVQRKQTIVYFRFAKHEPLLKEQHGVTIHKLRPETGFDAYIREIHDVIDKSRQKAIYIFDCLSELVVDWRSDRMLGNFFMLTCPHLYDVGAIAYFALLRDNHSFHATKPITDTAQVVINIYRYNEKIYVHPSKVQHRNSPTMYMPHVWEGSDFTPVTQSITTSAILQDTTWNQLDIANFHQGFWSSTFAKAENIQAAIDKGGSPPDDLEEFTEHLRHMLISQDEQILEVAKKYIGLKQIVDIRRRMIGTGLVGGKSVGMLLARAILEKKTPRLANVLEPHDSFFIGSDVFCTYLVQNGCWWAKQTQRNPDVFLDSAMRARQQMLTGTFPEYLLKQFEGMLDYFGQSPIIVRSSSLLEDAFGNAFAGKHDSVFCANQGSPDKRMENFLSAVRTVYASIMSEDALKYRAARGLLDRDEQMALLIQRVSGAAYGHRFYPQAAGVALSLNPYVWSEYIKASAGVMRIVFGLGTRAVERTDDDYTRIVALNAPERRPETDSDAKRQYAQHKVDYLDMEANLQVTGDFEEVARNNNNLHLKMFASRDITIERYASEKKIKDVFSWVLTFDKLLKDTPFVKDMREILSTLQRTYNYPVEIEYALNFFEKDKYKINLLQCRPLQIKGNTIIAKPPENISSENLILKTEGPVIGQSRVTNVDRIIYIAPSTYSQLATYDRYAVARTIGLLTHLDDTQDQTTMILGPGRWGSTMPSLGVPVTFTEINTVNVICEIVTMRDNLVPDVSLGTHFFNELVEMDILYFALFPDKDSNLMNEEFLKKQPSKFLELLPEEKDWDHVIRVIDIDKNKLVLNANTIKQKIVCYTET
ncbi:MAG: pyruvate, phosphate dikinase [Kiritimatiellae bacterium]|nr:pyruvate, phosphate dikinase [Kiritimatiellia bacterium]